MKTQKELISYYTTQAKKITDSYGFGSDASMSAMFKLVAVTNGMPETEIFDYANNEIAKIHDMALDQCNSIKISVDIRIGSDYNKPILNCWSY